MEFGDFRRNFGQDPHHSLETSMTFGKFGGLRHNPAASLTACEQGASRKLAPEEVDDDAIRLEARYIRHWGNFAWRGDPNLDGGGVGWPPAGAGGSTAHVRPSSAAHLTCVAHLADWLCPAQGLGQSRAAGQRRAADCQRPVCAGPRRCAGRASLRAV